MARLHKFINRIVQNWNWLVKHLNQVTTWSVRLNEENPQSKPSRRSRQIFTKILKWGLVVMQERNLILHRPRDNIWLSSAVHHCMLLAVISGRFPQCRPPNNIQLLFFVFLKDTDCCQEHLAKALIVTLWPHSRTSYIPIAVILAQMLNHQ